MAKLGVIGCGNMGGAMVRMIVKSGILKAEEILAADISGEQRARLNKDTGVSVTDSNIQAASAEPG